MSGEAQGGTIENTVILARKGDSKRLEALRFTMSDRRRWQAFLLSALGGECVC